MALSGDPADVQAEEDALQGHGGHADLLRHAATPALLVISTTAHQLQEGSGGLHGMGFLGAFSSSPNVCLCSTSAALPCSLAGTLHRTGRC
jgi:hypothetical protein